MPTASARPPGAFLRGSGSANSSPSWTTARSTAASCRRACVSPPKDRAYSGLCRYFPAAARQPDRPGRATAAGWRHPCLCRRRPRRRGGDWPRRCAVAIGLTVAAGETLRSIGELPLASSTLMVALPDWPDVAVPAVAQRFAERRSWRRAMSCRLMPRSRWRVRRLPSAEGTGRRSFWPRFRDRDRHGQLR